MTYRVMNHPRHIEDALASIYGTDSYVEFILKMNLLDLLLPSIQMRDSYFITSSFEEYNSQAVE